MLSYEGKKVLDTANVGYWVTNEEVTLLKMCPDNTTLVAAEQVLQ